MIQTLPDFSWQGRKLLLGQIGRDPTGGGGEKCGDLGLAVPNPARAGMLDKK